MQASLKSKKARTIALSMAAQFRKIADSFTRLAPLLNSATPAPSAGARWPPRLSPAQRAALKLQGKYMGTMRGLSVKKRAQVKKVRVEKGIWAAIRAAERMVW